MKIELTTAERKLLCAPKQNAIEAIGKIEPGFRIELVNCAQFSLIDVVRALLLQTGPAHVTISTWSTSIKDAANAAWMLRNKEILSIKLLIDRGFKTLEKQKTYFQRLEDWYGKDSILQCRTHAKFVLIKNKKYNIAIRTSANLNTNIRLEQFSIDDDEKLVNFYAGVVESWAGVVAAGFGVSVNEVDRAFSRHACKEIESLPVEKAPTRLDSNNTNVSAELLKAQKITEAAFNDRAYPAALAGLRLQIDLASRVIDHGEILQDPRAEHLAEIERAIISARKKGSLTALSSLLRHRTTVLGLDKPEAPQLTAEQLNPPDDPAEHLAELVRAARRGRLTAEAQGSMVAAAHYLRQERELLRVGTASDAQIARATDDDLLTIIKDAAANLPEEVRAQLGDLALADGGGVH